MLYRLNCFLDESGGGRKSVEMCLKMTTGGFIPFLCNS